METKLAESECGPREVKWSYLREELLASESNKSHINKISIRVWVYK